MENIISGIFSIIFFIPIILIFIILSKLTPENQTFKKLNEILEKVKTIEYQNKVLTNKIDDLESEIKKLKENH